MFQAGAEVDLCPSTRTTPLMVALITGAPNSLIQSLLQSGTDPHLSDIDGNTVLHFALTGPNVWVIKWLVAENVDLEKPVRGSIPVLQYLLDDCDASLRDALPKNITRALNSLRAMQVLASAGTNHAGNPFSVKQTQAQLIERLISIIPRSLDLAKDPNFRTYEMMGEDLREVQHIVHILTDILSNPLPLKQLCRVLIRRSLGKAFRKKLNQLNLPLPIHGYLSVYKMSDIVLWFCLAKVNLIKKTS